MKQAPTLLLKRVSRIYREGKSSIVACREVSLSVLPGERVAIMGPSGSGKSTLLNLIGLLDVPSSGSVTIAGEQITHLTRARQLAYLRREQIGFVFQTFNLLPRLTAVENVMLPMVYAGRPGRKDRATKLLIDLGLGRRLNHLPNQLSGGERQRVAIARALANDPALILADEPTGNLDSTSGKSVISRLLELKESGKTVIVVTHDPNIAKQMDRIIFIKDGRVVQQKLI